jgi:hypothetical protein
MKLNKKIQSLFSSQTAVFKQFCDTYDLVYFGNLHQQDDDQRIVRGVTVSTRHNDENYCVGTVHGYDMVLLKRTDVLDRPNSKTRERYSWIIMQFDLRDTQANSHVFIDGGHYNDIFYQTLFIKFARLMKVEHSAFPDDQATFLQRFSVYTPPDNIDQLPIFLSKEMTDTMVQHFSHLDFEWFQDRLLVYSTGRMPTNHLLEHMLRAGLWLSRELDRVNKEKAPDISEAVGTEVPSWRA